MEWKMIGRKNRAQRFLIDWNPLEERALMAAPVISPIADVQIPSGKTLMVPLSATDADGDPITYTATSNSTDPASIVQVRAGHPFMKISVANYGDMTFQLFDDIAPNTVSTITTLVNQKFYDGLTFHRMIKDFMIQGGDPKGDGTGGPGFKFADEFSPMAIFSGYGQLAMANSGKDTNGSQFFITTSTTRYLDFNHTIWGQLVKGFDVLAALNSASAPVTMSSVKIVPNSTESVLYLKLSGTSATQVSVTAKDPAGASDTKTFNVTPVDDKTLNPPINDPPILGPVYNITSYTNKPINIQLSSFDYENDEVTYGAAFGINPAPGTFSITNGLVSITPTTGYKGTYIFRVGVRQTNAFNRGSTSDPWDIQDINIRIDDPFQTTSKSVTVVEGQKLANTVLGTFVPLIPKSITDYDVTIDIGNGQSLPALLNVTSQGAFEITSPNAFARFGNYNVKITVTDKIDNVSTVINSTATVNDAPISVAFAAPQRQPGSGQINSVIATITDANPTSLPSDFSATINWGDGTTNSGIVQLQDGALVVVGSRTYTAFGTYNVAIQVSSTGGKSASASGSIIVSNAIPVFSPIPSKQVSEKDSLNFTVVANDTDTWQTLTYSLLSNPPAGVTINAASGQISVPAGLTPGAYNFSVKATDNGTPAQSATTPVSILVSDAALSATFVNPDRQTGSGLINSILTSVIDSYNLGKASDLSASIAWGDGTTSAGAIETQSGANFAVRGNHAYTSEGTFFITVTVTSKYGSTAQATGQIVVANAVPVIQPISDKLTDEGTPLSFAVQATDSDTWQKLAYKLGNGAPTGVSIDPATGILSVSDKTAPGSYAISIQVSDDGTPSKSAIASFNLQVKPVNHPPVISFAGQPATSFYRNFSYGISGKILDSDFAPLATATVDFGAGAGPQPITFGSDGSFSVNNIYTATGNFVVKIRALDQEGLASEKTLSLTIVNPPVRPVGIVANRTRTGLISSLVITFDGDLNAVSARNLANYQLLNPGRDRKLGTRDDLRIALRSATYDAARRTITLTPRAGVNIAAGLTFQLQIKNLLDSSQAAVDGDRNLTPGGTVLVNLSRTSAALA